MRPRRQAVGVELAKGKTAMGVFDDVRFDYRMPDGYETFGYQTKDVGCTGDTYQVSAQGRLLRTSSSGWPDGDRPLVDLCFHGVLNIYDSDNIRGTGWHEYDLTFVGGNLVEIRCHQTSIRLVFEPDVVGILDGDGIRRAGEGE